MSHSAPTSQFEYIETTIPAGMTIADYRASRRRPSDRWSRLRHALTLGAS
jgi:hypothetical protein